MNRVKILREAKGLGQREMAKDMETKGFDVSWATINKLERNLSNPQWTTIQQLCKYFHVSADYLMGTDLERPVPKTIAAHNDDGLEGLPPKLQLVVEKFYRKQLEHESDDKDSKE